MLQVRVSGQNRIYEGNAAIPSSLIEAFKTEYKRGYEAGVADTLASQQAPRSSPQPQRLFLSNPPDNRFARSAAPSPSSAVRPPANFANQGQPGTHHLVRGLGSFSLSGASRHKRHAREQHADSDYTSADAAPALQTSSVGAVSAASRMVRPTLAAGGAQHEVDQSRSEKSKDK